MGRVGKNRRNQKEQDEESENGYEKDENHGVDDRRRRWLSAALTEECGCCLGPDRWRVSIEFHGVLKGFFF